MEGNFRDGKNSFSTVVTIIILIVGLIAMAIISVFVYASIAFTLVGVFVIVFLMVAVSNFLSKGKFSADEKSVSFSVGFNKCEYSYRDIINVKTETTFTNGRNGAKIPHIEIILSLRSGEIVRFSDTVPSCESESLENLKKYQKNHQFTKLADYIKLKL